MFNVDKTDNRTGLNLQITNTPLFTGAVDDTMTFSVVNVYCLTFGNIFKLL